MKTHQKQQTCQNAELRSCQRFREEPHIIAQLRGIYCAARHDTSPFCRKIKSCIQPSKLVASPSYELDEGKYKRIKVSEQ